MNLTDLLPLSLNISLLFAFGLILLVQSDVSHNRQYTFWRRS